jgi:LPPG:FO 2-phospho-L-lactate transferase
VTTASPSRSPELAARGATILALAGGVGGAKLAAGLARELAPEALTVVVNTGDDFEHLGLHVSPDLDTVMYTLAGLANTETGWGLAGESWNFMTALERLGGETWFKLGDNDLATHIERTRRLAAGETLSEITADFCRRLGIGPRLAPMSDAPVRTLIETARGVLGFQEYFVREKSAPRAVAVRFAGAERAAPSPAFAAALERADLAAIIICPSNPVLSVLPILEVAGVRRRLGARSAPVVAVSPIVGGRALKGPAAKIMTELGFEASAAGVAAFYGDLIDGLVIDTIDAAAAPGIEAAGPRVLVTEAVMHTPGDQAALARDVLAFAGDLEPRRSVPVGR